MREMVVQTILVYEEATNVLEILAILDDMGQRAHETGIEQDGRNLGPQFPLG